MAFTVPYAERPVSKDELACVYSALILVDDNIPVTAEKITTILQAAGVQVESIWPSLFARALQGVDIRQLITGVGAGFGGGVVPGGPAAAGGAPGGAAAPEAPEEKPAAPPAPEEDSEDEDFGFGLFD